MYKQIKMVFGVIVVCAMAWQLFVMFEKYEDAFLDPTKFTRDNYGKDGLSIAGKRYEELKKMFPNTTHICYMSEESDNFPTWSANYCFTQYFAGPVVFIKDKKDCDTILYNLHWSKKIDTKTNYHLNNGWHIVKDFDNGLIVLAK